jgi:hypothetical protein
VLGIFMRWKKHGLICSKETIGIPWFTKNIMVPVPFLLNEKCLRIFVAMCDDDNVARIGYIDVMPDNPKHILGYSESPVLDVGNPGTFSEHGVLPSSIIEMAGSVYIYYSAYQRLSSTIPYTIFSGLAVGDGHKFKNQTHAPILDRVNNELFVRAAPVVFKEENFYRVFYVSSEGIGWINDRGKLLPSYDIKQFTTHSLDDWRNLIGTTSIKLLSDGDEFGLSKISLWLENGIYKAIFAVRSVSKIYRLGYAESTDGIIFNRKDKLIGLDVSRFGWDSEMITFPEIYRYKNRTYLFYCGNGYGLGGLGYAELIDQ